MKIEDVKKEFQEKIFKKANVVGVGIGYKFREKEKTDEMCIVCLVEKKINIEKLKKRDIIPEKIKEFKTDIMQVGKLRALQIDKTARHRPCPMGTSGGHYLITAGTNGELLKDKKEGKICIGTNNHVGANSNNAQIGDPYFQPGPIDGGINPNNIIGSLLRFIPIKFAFDLSTCSVARFWSGIYNIFAKLFNVRTRLRPIVVYPEYNLVDAALIEVKEKDVSAEIVGIGIPKGVKEAEPGMLVQKSGRTTCHTIDGEVRSIATDIGPINYDGKSAYFKDQIVISNEGFSGPGDSGSLILDMDGYAVGKLFAGGETTTIANPIQIYLDLLEAELVIE